MLAAHIFGVALYSFRPTLVGIRARLKNTRSFRRQTIIYFAGPLETSLQHFAYVTLKAF